MRLWVALPLALITVSAGGIGLFSLWHGVAGPDAETVSGVPDVELPRPFRIAVDPLDRERPRVRFGAARDASARKNVALDVATGTGTDGFEVVLFAREESLPATGQPWIHRQKVGSEGLATFPALPAGRYELRVRDRHGIAQRIVPELELEQDTRLRLEAAPRDVTFHLEQEHAPGDVRPLEGAQLILARHGRTIGSGRADDRGRVTLAVAPGAIRWRIWSDHDKEWSGATELTGQSSPVRLVVKGE